MRIERLKLSNFRCFREEDLDLGADLVAVYGRNGVGKTALFDAIEFALFGRVQRLFRFDPSLAPLRNVYSGSGEPSSVRIHLSGESWVETSIASGSETSVRSSEGWSTHLDLLYGLVVNSDFFPPRRRAEQVEDMFRSTLLLSQDSIRRFVEGAPEDRASVLATLAGSAHLLRLSEKATQVADEARRRGRAASQSEEEAAGRSAEIARALAEAVARLEEISVSDKEEHSPGSSELTTQLATAGLADLQIPENSESFLVFCADVRTRLEERVESSSRLGDRYARLVASWDSHLSRQARLAEIVAEFGQVDAALVDAERDRASSETLIVAIATAIREYRERIASLDRLIRASAEKAALETHSAECSTALGAAREQCALDETQLEEANQERRRLDGELERLLAERSALQRKHEAGRGRSTALERYQASEARMGEWGERLAAIEVLLARLEEDRMSYEQKLVDAKQGLERGQSRIERIRSSIDSLAAVADEKNALIARLREHISDGTCPLCGTAHESTEALLAAVDRSLESTPPKLTVLVEDLSAARELHREFSASKVAAEQQLERIRLEVARLSDERESINAKVADADRMALDLGLRRGEVSNKISECREQLRLIEEGLRNSADGIDASREARAAQAGRVDEAKQMSQSSRERLRDLEDKQATIVAELAQASADVERESASVPVEHSLDRSGQLAAARDSLATKEVERQRAERDVVRARERASEARRRRPALEQEHAELSGLEADFARNLAEAGLDLLIKRDQVTRLQEQNARKSEALRSAQATLARYETARRRQTLATQVEEIRGKLEEAKTLEERYQGELRRLEEGEREAKRWSDVLRGQVNAAIEATAVRHQLRIERHFKSLLPSPHQFERVVLEFRDGELKLGIRFRGRSTDEGEPRLFLSNAQANVLAISMFLSFGATKRWTNLNTLLLDDPVQHLDDLDAVAFLDTLRATALGRFGSKKQIVVSTCDRNLYLMMLKKFRAIEGEGLRFRGISLVGQGPSGPQVIYDHRPPERVASVG